MNVKQSKACEGATIAMKAKIGRSTSKVRGKQGEKMAAENITGRPGGEQPKKHAPKSRVVSRYRRRKIIEAALDCKDLKPVAISLGLSPKSADSQIQNIMREPAVQQAFTRVMEAEGISDQFLAQKIRDLLDAQETKYFQKDGIVTDQREVAALETQRKTTELAAKLKGHLKDRSEVDVNIGLMALVVAAVRERSGEDDGGFDV